MILNSPRRRRLAAVGAALCSGLLASAAASAPPPRAADNTTQELRRIDRALGDAVLAERYGESAIAESHRRTAAREAWTVLGRIAVADRDLEAARDAFAEARRIAATDFAEAREWLALVELHLAGVDGDVEAPLRELRYGVGERVDDAAMLRRFVEALWATGRREEFAAELKSLRELDAVAADLVEAWSAAGGPLPALDAGDVGGRSAAERAELAARLQSQLAELEVHLAPTAASSGDVPPPTVAPFKIDPSAVLALTPPSLRPVLDLLDAGRRPAAVAALRAAADGEDGPAAQELLGRVLAEDGDFEAAEATLAEAIRFDPDPQRAQQALARLYWLDGRRGEALLLLRQAAFGAELERDLAWALATEEIAEQRFTQAREQLESLHKRFDSARALLALVEVARAEDAPKRAFDAAKRALVLAPNAEAALLAHARLALEIQVSPEAAGSVEALARYRPDSGAYQFLLGEVWRLRREAGSATEAYLRALELDPALVEARKPLGLALNHESRFEEGREQLLRFLEHAPEDPDALAGLAEAEERLGAAEAAEQRALGVLATVPDHPRALLVAGLVVMGRGDFGAARPYFERAVDGDPWLAKAHYQLSFACARLSDRTCAKRHLELYRKALEGPESEVVEMRRQPSGAMTLSPQGER
ncbi:MAG: tetratricopeptide repeat protein [Acidobacteriota bacterium]